jgi:hypothetical protein
MDQSGELDAEMREMVRGEQKELVIKQLELEAAITTMIGTLAHSSFIIHFS